MTAYVFNSVAFPDPDPVTGPPTFDGWTAVDPTMAIRFTDPGWATAGQLTFVGGSQFPPVVFEFAHVTVPAGGNLGPPPPFTPVPVDAGEYLMFSAFCAFDYSFDLADGMTIGIIPDLTKQSDYTTHRRFDVAPITSVNVGAGYPIGVNGDGGPNVPPLPSGDGGTYGVRYQRPVPNLTARVGLDGSASGQWWQEVSFVPTAIQARAASWTPTAPGAHTVGAVPIPNNKTTNFTLPLDAVAAFPTNGEVTVTVQPGITATIGYTGINNNTLTGCQWVSGFTGTAPSNSSVALLDYGWSFELLIPLHTTLTDTTTNPPTSHALDIQDQFGLYLNLYRFSNWAHEAPPNTNALAVGQYRFPLPEPTEPDQQYLIGTVGDFQKIDQAWYGTAVIPRAGKNTAVGVGFQPIGTPVGVLLADNSFGTQVDYSANPADTRVNTLEAFIQNSDPHNPAAGQTVDITAEFRFADWGVPPGTYLDWDSALIRGADTPTDATLDPAIDATTPATGMVTETWKYRLVPQSYVNQNMGHHCVWVRLSSKDAVNFVQSGLRVNMNFYSVSEQQGTATISGKGRPKPPSGSYHTILLMPHARIVAPPEEDSPPIDDLSRRLVGVPPRAFEEDQQVFMWVVEAFRRTGLAMTVGKTTAEIVDPIGEFGINAVHESSGVDTFVHELYGGGVRRIGRAYEVRVPDGGSTTVQTSISANPPASYPPPHLPETIRPGAHGDTVGLLQLLLSAEGYGIGAHQVDEIFGPETEALVKAFQTLNAMAVDGVVGPITWSGLFALAPVRIPPLPGVLGPGATGAPVTALQGQLNTARPWFARWLAPITVTGTYDAPTAAMVKTMQAWAGIAPSGTTGYSTWAVSAGPSLWVDAGAPGGHPIGATPVLRQGESGPVVQEVKFLLHYLGYGLSPAQLDGAFGAGLGAAVRQFQRAVHLAQDGVVGPLTWKALRNPALVGPRPLPPELQTSPNHSPVVQSLQHALEDARPRFAIASPPLATDGIYGPQTAARVKALQTWAGIRVDGIVGPQTWSVAIGPSLWSL